MEEAKLAAAFPVYAEYLKHTRRFFPSRPYRVPELIEEPAKDQPLPKAPY